MKKLFLIMGITLLINTFTACTNFNDVYKPLYQAKPKVESIRGKN